MCEELNVFADWQWNVNPWGKQDHPGTAVNHYLLHGDPGADGAAVRDVAFAWLRYGQRHDPRAQAAYDACRATAGDDHLFVAVLRSAAAREPDFAEVGGHLEWQAHSDPLSILESARHWRGEAAGTEPAQVAAVYSLLRGQAHNANSCQLYRACFAADPARLFALVRTWSDRAIQGELRHPYLEGAGPSPLSIRDEVPTDPAPGER